MMNLNNLTTGELEQMMTTALKGVTNIPLRRRAFLEFSDMMRTNTFGAGFILLLNSIQA